MSSLKERLLTVLRSGARDPLEIERALVSYIKGDEGIRVNEAKVSNLLKPEPLYAMCGLPDETKEPAKLDECVGLIEKCMEGEESCIQKFFEIKESIKNGFIFNKSANDQVMRNILRKLGVDINSADPIKDWAEKLAVKASVSEDAKTKVRDILSNEELKKAIKVMIVKAKHPEIKNASPEQLEKLDAINTLKVQYNLNRRDQASISPPMPVDIKGFNRRGTELKDYAGPVLNKKVDLEKGLLSPSTINTMLGRRGLEQSGGGGDDNDKIVYLRDDSYQRQIDYLDNIFNMTGGSKRSNYLHLFSLYNRFVAELRANNKQIEENDDAIIRQHLSLLKETEDKLNQIILYTLKYREIKDDPEFKTLVEQNPVTVNLLQQLDTEYDTKLETKRVELEGKYRDRGKKGVNMLQALLEARGSFKQDFEKIVKEGLGMI